MMPAGNALAVLMLAIWPVVSWILFTKLDRTRALIWSILGGYMLMPPAIGFDLPLVPDLDKNAIGNLSAAAAILFLLKERFAILPKTMFGVLIAVFYAAGIMGTTLSNADPIWFEQSMLPGMRAYDSLSLMAKQMIGILPFFMARQFLSDWQSMRQILIALVIAGFAYSLPMLIEARISPQLNIMIYGYFQHDFSQAIRFDGFRPFVFMPHGLWVAFFALMCLVSAVALLRTEDRGARSKYVFATIYLAALLVVCKSAGPLIYAIGLVPLILIMPPRFQILVALFLVSLVIAYPLLRGLHLLPIHGFIDYATSINEERGRSLAFRLLNEELLIDRAALRPLFGWGSYGRGLIHDPVTGQISVIADGGWIITLGSFGWLGYIATYGFLTLPIIFLARETLFNKAAKLSRYACAITLILAANLFDLLPNDTIIPFTWLIAGAVFGHAQMLRSQRLAQQHMHYEEKLPSGRTIL